MTERQTMQWLKEKKIKWQNNDPQNTTNKTIDWATQTPLKAGWAVPAPLVAPVMLLCDNVKDTLGM